MSFNHNLTLAFLIIFSVMMIPVLLRSNLTTRSSRANTEYSTKLTAAAHSGIQVADPKGLVTASYIWTNEGYRKKALDSFFHSLCESFMQGTNNDSLQVAVPIIILIDIDGYYMNYNALFDWASIHDITKMNDFDNQIQMGSLTPWSENKYGYYIRYFLTDYTEITTSNGKVYKGDRHEVASLMEKDLITGDIINYLNGTMHQHKGSDDLGEAYIWNRDHFIVDAINTEMASYINERNYSAGRNGGGYDLEMPEISGEMWHRMLENPTLLSFLQGHNINNSKETINTFAYAGAEVFKGDKYFITTEAGHRDILKGSQKVGETDENKVYHSFRQEYADGHITENADGDFVFTDGSIINKLYFTMGDCAKEGAVPCPECIQ